MHTTHTNTQENLTASGTPRRSDKVSAVAVKVTGGEILVSKKDLRLVKSSPWHLHNGYAFRRGEPLHRLILSVPDGCLVDHINGNPSDNRRENLRPCRPFENARNKKKNLSSTCDYKGVSPGSCSGFFAQIAIRKRTIKLGHFKTQEEAALAYDAAARYLFKDFARCNFSDRRIDVSDLDGVTRVRLRLLNEIAAAYYANQPQQLAA